MIAVKAAVVVGFACAVALTLRRRSASLRHAVLALGFLIACVLPALERLAPAWGSAVAPVMPTLVPAYGSEGQWLWTVWLAGAAFGLAALACGLARLVWLRLCARRDVPAVWQAILDDGAREFAVRRPIALLETDRIGTPVTWGLLRPTILLPQSARAWTDECVRAVVRHELAHVQRGDWAVQLAAAGLTRIFWFNPLMWFASRWLRLESDRACDDAVLNLGIDGADYATHLIHVARTVKNGGATIQVAPAAARASGFARRIAAALDSCVDRTPLSACAATALALGLTTAAVPVAGFGRAAAIDAPSLLNVQRDVLRRFGGEERRFSIVSQDVSFWKNRLEGRVELQARLNVDGSVSGVRIVEPVHPDLASAAETIVRHWRREPARVRGVAVEIPIRMTVDFRR